MVQRQMLSVRTNEWYQSSGTGLSLLHTDTRDRLISPSSNFFSKFDEENQLQLQLHLEVCIWYLQCQCSMSCSALTITKHIFGTTQYSRVKMAIQLWCSHIEVSDAIWCSLRRPQIRLTASKRSLMLGWFSEYCNQWRSLVFGARGEKCHGCTQQELL